MTIYTPTQRLGGHTYTPIKPGGGGGGPTVPPVTGYTAWYDASQITGQADNTALATWPDLSGNGNTLTQSQGINMPTYYSSTAGKTVNGKPAVWFNTANSTCVVSSPFASLSTSTIFLVSQVTAVGGGNVGTFYDGLDVSHRNTLSGFVGSDWGLYAGSAADSGILADGALHAFGAVFNGANSYLNVDGNLSAAINPGVQPLTGLIVGANVTKDVGYSLTGPICEMIVYPSALSPSQILSVIAYLKTKWGTP